MNVFLYTPRSQEGETALQLAISNQLPLVVDAICTRGADMSVVNDKGDPPLWLALENDLEDIASTLVSETYPATVEMSDIFVSLWYSASY